MLCLKGLSWAGQLNDINLDVKAGEVLFIPNGTIHAVKNVGGGDAVELAT